MTVNGLKFNNTGGNATITVTAVTGVLTIATNQTVAVTGGDHVITGVSNNAVEISLPGASTWNVSDGASLTVSARMIKGGTRANFTKSGSGLLVIDNDNGGTGSSNVTWLATAGTLRFNSGGQNAVGTSANPITVTAGASVETHVNFNQNPLTLNGTGVNGNGALRVLSGNLTSQPGAGGTTTLASDSSIYVAPGASINMNKAIGQSGGARALTKIGGGTMQLSVANTFTGGLKIEAGTVNITSATPSLSGSNSIALSGVALPVAGADYGTLTFGGTTLTLGGSMSFNFSTAPVETTTYSLLQLGTGATAGTFSGVSIGGTFATGLTQSGNVWSGSEGLHSFNFNQTTGNLVVTAVPEPSSFAVLAGMGALGFVASRRRRSVR
jgi:autotransporter-associated beta strand protein